MNNHIETGFFKYWEETRKYPLIREEEVHRLFQEKERSEACEIIILRNLQLVCKTVYSSWRNSAYHLGISLDDLTGSGNIGLIKGTYKYVPSKGSYLKYISSYISGFLKAELCRNLNFSRAEVDRRLKGKLDLNPTDRLSDPVATDDEENELLLEDVIPCPDDERQHLILDANNLLIELRKDYRAPHRLSPEVIELRYGVGRHRNYKPLSLSAAARVLNLSKEGVRQIEAKTAKYLTVIAK